MNIVLFDKMHSLVVALCSHGNSVAKMSNNIKAWQAEMLGLRQVTLHKPCSPLNAQYEFKKSWNVRSGQSAPLDFVATLMSKHVCFDNMDMYYEH